MNHFRTRASAGGLFVLVLTLFAFGSVAQADGNYAAHIVGISPQGAISPGTMVTFSTTENGFVDPVYSVSDSFGATGATVGTVDQIGTFTWTPGVYDAGTHTITISVTDMSKNIATTTATIIVSANVLIVTNLAPATTTAVRTPISFSVEAPGFVTPSFAVYDSTGRSSLMPNNIDSSGNFSWTPTLDDIGSHLVVITASDFYGHHAQTVQPLQIVLSTSTPPVATTTPITAFPIAPRPVSPPAIVPAPDASAAPIAPHYTFSTPLHVGSRGTAVTALQQRLTALGLYSGPITGYYGVMTASSVTSLQRAHGLAQVGSVGPATRALLNQ